MATSITMADPGGMGEGWLHTILKDVLPPLVVGVCGYLVGLLSKTSPKQVVALITQHELTAVRPLNDRVIALEAQVVTAIASLEKRVIEPLTDRVARLEVKTDGHVTRAEFREAITDLKATFEHHHGLLNASLSDLKADLRARRD